MAKGLTLSTRGEYEITDINKEYLKKGKLKVNVLKRGTAWLDTGTFDSLMQSSQFIQTIEKRQGLKVGSIEEVAYRKGFIGKEQMLDLAEKHKNSDYGDYLKSILEE